MRVPQRLGPYELLGLLGQGAMGAVYRARHCEMGAVRAVKVLLGSSPTQTERFLRESRNLARVRHPNIVGVHESGAENGHLYYAMDLVEGRPLDDVLGEGRLSFERAMALAVGICRGVDALHALGIVHRDLKPANVVLDRHGNPIVLDLGLAVAPELDQRLTKTGAFVGTPWYMAPEQARAEPVTPRSDVYSLGLITHELLSGYSICESGELPGFVQVPLPSSVDASLPRALDRVCARATSKAPAERYERASGLADALEAVAQDPGITRRTVRQLKLALGLLLVSGAVGAALAWPRPPVAPPLRRTPPSQRRQATNGGAAATAGLGTETARRGRRELRALRRREPRVRHAELLEWLKTYEDHPDADRARAYLRDARLRFPLRDLLRGKVGDHLVVFVKPNLLAWTRTTRPTGSGELQLVPLDPSRALRKLQAESRYVALAASPSGERIAFSERRGTWLLEVAQSPTEPVLLTPLFMNKLAFSADGKTLAAGRPRETVVHIFDVEQPQAPPKELGPYRGDVQAMALSADGRYLAVSASVGSFVQGSGSAQSLDLWDLSRGDAVYRREVFSQVNALAFSPTAPYFVAGASDGRLVRWGVTGQETREQYEGPKVEGSLQGENPSAHARSIRAVAFSPDGAFLHSLGPTDMDKAGLRRIWNASTRELLASLDHRSQPLSMSIAPDGNHLVVVTDTAVELWDAGVPRLLNDPTANGSQPGEGE